MSVRALPFLIAAFAACSAQAAPSFDCKTATKPVEKAICADPGLAALDSAIAEAYGQALARVAIDAGAVTRLREQQRTFVAERNAAFVKPGYRMDEHLAAQKALLTGWPESAHALGGADVSAWVKTLPKEVFDATSDGISDDAEMTRLVTTGENRDFTLTRLDARRAVARCRHNTDRVEFTVEALPEPVLIAHTRNMQASTFSYWRPEGSDAVARPHRPSIAVQAAAESLYAFRDDAPAGPGLLTAVAPDVARHLAAREECAHWAGEVSDDLPAERRRQIEKAVARLKCDRLPAEETRLRETRAADAHTIALLDKADELLGD